MFLSQNLHSLYLRRHSAVLREAQAQAEVVRIDGLPIVHWGRLLGREITYAERAGFMDLIPDLMRLAVREGWRVTFLGGVPGVADRAALALRETYPGLELRTLHGYFDMEDRAAVDAVVRAINGSKPDVLIVGMGMPRQERFLLENRSALEAGAMLTCGAAFDYIAGEVPMAPRWLSRAGFEWLFRLAAQPQVLWRRYLVEPLFLIPAAVEDLRRRGRGAAN